MLFLITNQSNCFKLFVLKLGGDTTDPKSIKNWLRQNGVTIHKLASRTFVYDLELKVCLLKPMVLDLIKKHPNQWREICRNIIDNDVVFELLLVGLEDGRPMILPRYKMQFNSIDEEKLYNDLVA
jgi:hypothetical protein